MTGTKEKILTVSLELFSQNGFTAVSIRDICKQVQIKESSVYYHFESKQAIFDELLKRFQKTATDMMSKLEEELKGDMSSSDNPFYEKVCNCFFEQYLMDDFCNKVMRLLEIEQLNNPEIQKIYEEWMFHKPLKFQEKVFSLLMEIGMVRKTDSAYLAIKYYSPIFFFAKRWLFSGTLSDENKNLFRMNAYGHIQKFFEEMEEK